MYAAEVAEEFSCGPTGTARHRLVEIGISQNVDHAQPCFVYGFNVALYIHAAFWHGRCCVAGVRDESTLAVWATNGHNCSMKRTIACTYLFLARWKAVGTPPDLDKYLMVAAPHTSNWDFPHLLMVAWALGVEVRFIGKHSIFRWPFGYLFRALGGIPVRRDAPGGIIEQIADTYRRSDRMALALAPEGTRGYADAWKSGFYRIARAADVPVVLAFIDYPTRSGGVGPLIRLTGNQDEDMARIAPFYADKVGKYPEQGSPVRLT